MAKLDAHTIGLGEYDEIPELTDEMMARAVYKVGGVERPAPRSRGRPAGSGSKVSTTIRIDADVLAAFKATGPGWQTRMNAALRGWLVSRK